MNKEFVKEIYKTLVEEGIRTYKEIYEKTDVNEQTISYWREAINLYNTFDDSEKDIFSGILKQTIIDTISSTFGILDGSSNLSGTKLEFDIKINGMNTEESLQDAFLEVVEERN